MHIADIYRFIKERSMTNEEANKISGSVIGAAMKVHRVLGRGFQELIYQRALAIEFQNRFIDFEREMSMQIFYEEELIGTRRVDFFVEDFLMVEIKAVSELDDSHLAQTMNYCQVYNLPYGLLINFGSGSLQYKRVYNLNHCENRSYVRKTNEYLGPSDI